jgi:hypothetical protein
MSSESRRVDVRRTVSMDRKRRWIAGGALALALIGCGAGLAIASAGDEEQQLTGPALDRATAAALAHTAGGTVVEAEAGDDGAAYGIEVRLEDGSIVDVALDASFRVVRGAPEDEGSADEEDGAAQNGADED